MSRRASKTDAILDAARSLFLSNGYVGTSMDAVATVSAVSKQTVYNNFGDKRSLFEELLTRDMSRADVDVERLIARGVGRESLEEDLVEIATLYLRGVLQPDLLRLRRLVIGEAERFPELAASWYKNGPEQAYDMFSGLFRELTVRGDLRVDEPRVAAEQFNWLVLAVPLNRAMAYVDEKMPPADAELEALARSAVNMFLAVYGVQGHRR